MVATTTDGFDNNNGFDSEDNGVWRKIKVTSLFLLLPFVHHLLPLTIVLLHLNCCAVNRAFKQIVRLRAAVPVKIVVPELGIFRAVQREVTGLNMLLRARRNQPP